MESYSEEYLKWVKQANLPPLTNTQYRFAEWLLKEEQQEQMSKIGDLESIFKSIRKYVKQQP